MSEEHRAILGVAPGAGRDDIRAAYRRAAKRAHPDMGGSSEAFQRVRAAFDALLAALEAGGPGASAHPDPDRERTALDGHWMTVAVELSAIWGLNREPFTVFAPQKIGLSPFMTGSRLNDAAWGWLSRQVGPRGENWEFHTAGSVTRLFFRRQDDARVFRVRFF